MIIDFHTHIFSPRVKRDRARYVKADPTFAMLYGDEKAEIITAEELIEGMDKDGIDISVALNIGWTTHELCVESNDYILESASRYPKRLVGFCSLQPKAGDEALREIERCARSGAKGFGELRPDTQDFDLAGEQMKPVVDAMVEHKLVLLTHASEPVGHNYPGKGSVTPEKLYRFITSFPELTVVCAHWGGGLPFYALMPEVKKTLVNVYYDTAASPYLYSPQIYQHIVQVVGSDKILFGSDFPLLKPGRLLKEIESLSLSAEVKAGILSGNARRILRMKDK